MTEEQPLFESVQDAVKFATAFNHSITPRSAMLQMASPSTGTGKGLSGLEGAGLSGIILGEVGRLATRMQHHSVIARSAQHYDECRCGAPCCSGRVINWAWAAAIEELSNELYLLQESTRDPIRRGPENNVPLRLALICRFFGEKTTLEALADAAGVTVLTASKHTKFIHQTLKREERTGWEVLDARLRDMGLVGQL